MAMEIFFTGGWYAKSKYTYYIFVIMATNSDVIMTPSIAELNRLVLEVLRKFENCNFFTNCFPRFLIFHPFKPINF